MRGYISVLRTRQQGEQTKHSDVVEADQASRRRVQLVGGVSEGGVPAGLGGQEGPVFVPPVRGRGRAVVVVAGQAGHITRRH